MIVTNFQPDSQSISEDVFFSFPQGWINVSSLEGNKALQKSMVGSWKMKLFVKHGLFSEDMIFFLSGKTHTRYTRGK